ncbi:Lon protease family protein [Vibrio sp. S4M6]|uniref:S16 family serine protease n=1 Tax=Vibrio sinus TaxID=2946865 RepID=UPI00202A2B62|nr:Lon protease family protein [Vibrio sinus]MCL9783104.1 Lon protease family protein [Vibrio sinus]
MNHESWRAVTPQFDNFSSTLEQYQSISEIYYLNSQLRLKKSFEAFVKSSGVTKVLTVNAPDNAIYRQLFAESLSSMTQEHVPVVSTEDLSIESVLGTYAVDKKGNITQQQAGLIEKADGGYILVSANMFTANPVGWFKLKSALLGEKLSPINLTPKCIPSIDLSKVYDVKIIAIGSRESLDDFQYLDPDIHYGLNLYTEYEPEIELTEESISTYLGFLKWLCSKYHLPTLDKSGLVKLMAEGTRFTEDQHYLPLDITWYRSLLESATLESQSHSVLTGEDIAKAIEAKYFRESYLPERALSDIFDGQVIIETKGECVGQVNGLTVIDVPGHPLSYGEPARISCVIHFGDGDISDVERKAELGGNLHAKGMMIMQAFVSSALKLDEPLPYSASVVFEQSYCEVDGDSASLAELCSFVSALSEYPINQQIAVTGAVDQFGRVQAVGGLNEKIEGFYHVCKHQGLTGKQGVILPKSNLKHLSLHKDVVESIKKEEFHIWSVSTVDEAVPILMNHPFRGDDNASVISQIAKRIEGFERHEHSTGILSWIKNWFV